MNGYILIWSSYNRRNCSEFFGFTCVDSALTIFICICLDMTKRYLTLVPVDAVTALFNNMRTLKFKSQPTNAFFGTANQMFGGSFQLPTTAERAVIKSNRRV